jgi:hypothetical protein
MSGATVGAPGDEPEVIAFERSIDLGRNADIQAVMDELRTAVTGMAAEAADEMREALLTFGVKIDDIARAAGAASTRGNRAQRRAASPPPHGGFPPHGGQPPKRRPQR